MPMYDFLCLSCQNKFEELVKSVDDAPACPACGGKDVVALPSLPGPAKTGPTPFPYKPGPVHPVASRVGGGCGGGGFS